MSTTNHYPVIVIGAGMAGLAAAEMLQEHGIEPLLLESKSHPGGRTFTHLLSNGVRIMTGAGFMMTCYKNTLKLVKKHRIKMKPLDKMNIEVLIDGKYYPVSSQNILTPLKFPLFSWREKFQFAAKLLLLAPQILDADVYKPHSLTKYDHISMFSFVKKNFSQKLAQIIVDPINYSLFGYSSKEMSLACFFSAIKETFGHKHIVPVGGIDDLARHLASKLKMRYGVSVEKITKSNSKVTVHTATGAFTADHVIVAVPGSKALRMLRNPVAEVEEFFSKVQYQPEQFFIVKTEQKLPIDSHALYPESAGHKISTVIQLEGLYYQVNFREPLTKFSLNKERKEAELRKVWLDYFPEYEFRLVETIEWESTIPVFYPGYLTAVTKFRYWQEHKSDRRVVFAGDYLQAPYIEGAVTSGQNAAQLLLGIR